MQQKGRLTQWNDTKGYGFLTPLSGGPRVFVHISQFQDRRQRPRLNDLVIYTLAHDEKNRANAKQVHYLNRQPLKPVKAKGFPLILPVAAAALILLALAYPTFQRLAVRSNQPPVVSSFASTDRAIADAFQAQQSGIQISGDGVVDRVLEDDDDGSRHQRFILRLASGQTLLVAHNIDIAPRIERLRGGDRVKFYGQYEWNPQGGVIHWTHHDPAGHHVSGWLNHNGSVYQ
jgi:cold shock CspA family protein